MRYDPGLNELPRDERWRFGVVVFGDVLARRTLEDLGPLLQEAAPDLLGYDELDIGAAAAGYLAGVPAVAHSLGRQLPDPIRRAALDRLGELVRGYGVEPGGHLGLRTARADRAPSGCADRADRCRPGLGNRGSLSSIRGDSPESVADAVRALLSKPEFREAAGRLADEIAAMPSPAETAAKLERLAAG